MLKSLYKVKAPCENIQDYTNIAYNSNSHPSDVTITHAHANDAIDEHHSVLILYKFCTGYYLSSFFLPFFEICRKLMVPFPPALCHYVNRYIAHIQNQYPPPSKNPVSLSPAQKIGGLLQTYLSMYQISM